MVSKAEALQEAYRRGILPESKKAVFEEAVRRGLIDADISPKENDGMGVQFLRGFNEKVTGIATAPARTLGKFADYTEEKTGIPSPFNELGDAAQGIYDYYREDAAVQPQTTGEKLARGGGEFLGETAPYSLVMGGVGNLAAQAPQYIKAGAGKAEQVLMNLLSPYVSSPAKSYAGEVTSAIGAGVGGEIGKQVAPNSDTAELLGQIGGASAPAAMTYTPSALAMRGGKAFMSMMSPERASVMAKSRVQGALEGSFNKEARQKLGESVAVQDKIPGFEPSLAESSGLQSLARTQQALEGQASGAILDNYVRRRELNQQAVARFAENVAPQSTLSPEYVVDAATGRINALSGKVGDAQKSLQSKKQILARALPEIDRAAAGDSIRNKIDTARAAVKEKMSGMAADLGINDVDVTVPFTNFQEMVSMKYKKGSYFDDADNIPSIIQEIKGFGGKGAVKKAFNPVTGTQVIKEAPKSIKFSDIKGLRERVSDDLMDTLGAANPNRKKVRVLTSLKRDIDEFLNASQNLMPENLVDNYNTFRKAYYGDYISKFENGAVYKVRQKDGRGFYRIPDERVAEQFFRKGRLSDARQYKEVFGDSQDAAMEAVVLDNLRATAVRDGVIDHKAYANWLRNHESVLMEFPDVAKKVAQIGTANKALLGRQANLEARQRTIQDSMLARQIQSMERGVVQPEQVINNAIKDPRKMAQLLKSIKPEAKQALKRQIWGEMEAADAAQLGGYLKNNEKTLRMALGSNHYNDLVTIQKARAMMDVTNAPAGRPVDPNYLAALEKNLGMGVNQISSRVFAVKSGRTSPRFVGIDMLSRFLRGQSQNQTAALFENALYDPRVARELVDEFTAPIKKAKPNKRLKAYLFNLGVNDDD